MKIRFGAVLRPLRRGRWSLSIAALAALLSLPAFATTLLRQDVAALARSSDLIVRGQVKTVRSRWSGDGRRIITDVEVEVAESWKGQPPTTLTVQQPGGQVGDLAQRVSGLASFREGEEVLLFLGRRPGNRYGVSGQAQGKYRLERAAAGVEPVAIPESTGDALLIDPATRQPASSTAAKLELKQLRAAVRSALATPEKAKP